MNVALILAAVLIQDPGKPYPVEVEKPQTRYWCQLPDGYTPTRSWPVMVLLHGAGDTAENFVKFWSGGGSAAGFILAAAKSRGHAWEDSDGDVILAVLADVKRKHNVDPDRQLLTGYSSGGFMSTRWGFKNTQYWRSITAIAGADMGAGKEYKAAQARGMTVLIECGELDPNLGICKNVFEKVKKDGFDCTSNWVPKMEHSPMLPQAMQWVYDQLLQRLKAPAEVTRRAKKAGMEKRFADSIAAWRELAGGADEKAKKAAETELAKLEKTANDKLAEAQKKAEKGDKNGAKKAYEEAAKYLGFESAEKAAEALKELRR